MNKVILIGRLTDDPEVKVTANGTPVTTFRLAVDRRNNRDITDFFTVITWRGLAEICGKYLAKGKRAAVLGEIQTRSYTDKKGNKRYITEIIADEVEFLSKSNEAITESRDGGGEEQTDESELLEDDESIPF